MEHNLSLSTLTVIKTVRYVNQPSLDVAASKLGVGILLLNINNVTEYQYRQGYSVTRMHEEKNDV